MTKKKHHHTPDDYFAERSGRLACIGPQQFTELRTSNSNLWTAFVLGVDLMAMVFTVYSIGRNVGREEAVDHGVAAWSDGTYSTLIWANCADQD